MILEQLDQRDQLADVLLNVLWQACGDSDDRLDSYALSAYAEGIRLLGELGLVEIEVEHGRRVLARLIPERRDPVFADVQGELIMAKKTKSKTKRANATAGWAGSNTEALIAALDKLTDAILDHNELLRTKTAVPPEADPPTV
jgi:hypothetical protein